MKTQNAELKALILNLLTFEDGVDEKGQQNRITSYPKRHFKGTSTLKSKVINDLEIAIVDKKEDVKEGMTIGDIPGVQWVANKDFQLPEDKKVISQRSSNAEIEFTDTEIAALRYFHEQREELIAVTLPTYEEFEALIAVKQ